MANKILSFTINHIVKFKNIIDTLKDITTDVCVIFNPQYVIFQNMDKYKQCFIHYKIDKECVSSWSCESNGCFNLNISYISQVLKSVPYNTSIEFFIYNLNELNMRIDNKEENTTTYIKIDLTDTENIVNFDELKFNDYQMFNISSMFLKKQFKNTDDYNYHIGFETTANQLHIFNKCDVGLKERRIVKTFNENITVMKPMYYQLNMLSLFTKAFTISKFVKIHLKEDSPLILQLQNEHLGTLSLVQSLWINND